MKTMSKTVEYTNKHVPMGATIRMDNGDTYTVIGKHGTDSIVMRSDTPRGGGLVTVPVEHYVMNMSDAVNGYTVSIGEFDDVVLDHMKGTIF